MKKPDHQRESFPVEKDMELSLQGLVKDLQKTCQERDKAFQESTRLKQHLLDKDSKEMAKMDEDSEVIEQLREENKFQSSRLINLEEALKQEISSQEGVKMIANNEVHKSKEVVEELCKKLASLTSKLDAKNVQLLDLECALGQCEAEFEAKERMEGDLALAREESEKQSELLKEADQKAEILRREKEDVLAKLSHAEMLLVEEKNKVSKAEKDNRELCCALGQNERRYMMLAAESAYSVDRRIVVNLLVAYLRGNHSREILDLMDRIMGFSDEDRQRIATAQKDASKGLVRGVFSLPGKLVGDILRGNSSDIHSDEASENQSIAKLWVDFLVKQTEETNTANQNPNPLLSPENIPALDANTANQNPNQNNPISRHSDSKSSPDSWFTELLNEHTKN